MLSDESTHRYRYRSRTTERGAARTSASAERIVRALAARRQHLADVRARLRSLAGKRNDVLAQAVGSGLRLSFVADILGETVPRIRQIALAVDDPPSAGLSRDEQVHALRAVRAELEEAASSKEAVERELRQLVSQAYALGFTDEAQLAAMAGLPTENVHRSLRWHHRRG